MKILLLGLVLTGCGLFEKAKVTVVDKVYTVSKSLAVSQLGCLTGEPLARDLKEVAAKALKVRSTEDSVSSLDGGSKSMAGSIGGTVCRFVAPKLASYLLELGESRAIKPEYLADG